MILATGRAGDDLLAAGGNLNISGPIADNAVIAGGTIVLAQTASVGRDLEVAGARFKSRVRLPGI